MVAGQSVQQFNASQSIQRSQDGSMSAESAGVPNDASPSLLSLETKCVDQRASV
jgi:hypothetical protein